MKFLEQGNLKDYLEELMKCRKTIEEEVFFFFFFCFSYSVSFSVIVFSQQDIDEYFMRGCEWSE
jgi:hypothetical protein